jgi:T5orf172 domain
LRSRETPNANEVWTLCDVRAGRFAISRERWWEKAFIYIAGSLSAQILKVGVATDVTSRIISLNVEGYAGIGDWKAVYWVETKNAGQKEYNVHLHLRDHICPRRYTKAGREVNCLETFACSANDAVSVVRSVADPLIEEWINRREIHRYQFKSVSGGRFVRKKSDTAKVSAQPIEGSKSRNSRRPKQATVTRIENAEEVPALRQAAARKPQATVRGDTLQVKPNTPQFHGFTARCPACGKLNRINANRAHLKPICGSRGCRASLVGLPTR